MTTKHELQVGGQVYDLTSVQYAEQRHHEIAFVTPQKAGELLAVFNQGYLDLVIVIGKVELERRRAERHADGIRSVLVLDKVKDILKAKGLSKDSNPAGSEDLRRAVLEGDTEYQDALDKVEEYKALLEVLRGKLKATDKAYYAVKSLVGDTYIPSARETRTNGIMPDTEPGEVAPSGRYGYRKPVI